MPHLILSQLPLVSSPFYSFEFPQKHRFPMRKFALLHDCLRAKGIATDTNIYRSGRIKRSLLELAHDAGYVDRFINGTMDAAEVRRMGLPWSEGLVKRSLISPNGTLLTCLLALQNGLACHLAGGTHHAHHNFASGYCVFNDLAIAALSLVQQEKVKRVVIFDCDVHQGDGTASILANTPEITTVSIHCEKNFPHRKASSDIDVEVAPGLTDQDYLAKVDETLAFVLNEVKADLLIYDAGVDIYEDDPLGLLNISLNGIRQRDRLVIETVRAQGIPLASVIGGGYDKDESALAARHAMVVEEAAKVFAASI